jgi:hypothetical protein
MMPMRVCTIVAVALLVYAQPAFGGAWTMDQGKGQITFSALVSQAEQSFDTSGNLQSTPRYRKVEAEALLEYGVTGRLTAMLGPGFQHIDIAPPTGASRTGAGFTDFGARYRVMQGSDWVLSVQGMARVPGTSDAGNPAAVGYTGAELDARVLFGKSFNAAGLPAFIDLEAAQRFQDASPNEFRFDATLGIRLAPRWQLLGQSFTVIAESGDTLIPSYNYSKLQLSAVYDLTPRWSVQLGGFATVLGHNALQENGLVAGLRYKF